jgi:hypothetical protein
LALGVGNVFRALLGDANFADPIGPSPWPEPDVSALLARLKTIHNVA